MVSKSQVLGTAKLAILVHQQLITQTHPKRYQNRWFSKWQVLGTFKTRNFGAPAVFQSAPKERRRRRTEKRSSKRVFLVGESVSSLPSFRFALKTPENLEGAGRKRSLQKHPLDDRFSARRLLRSFTAPAILVRVWNNAISAPPPENHVERRMCNPGGGVYVAALLGSDNSYTTPSKIPLLRSEAFY